MPPQQHLYNELFCPAAYSIFACGGVHFDTGMYFSARMDSVLAYGHRGWRGWPCRLQASFETAAFVCL